MPKKHHYLGTVSWTGNKGSGTSNYRSCGRDYEINAETKPTILGSSDPAFRGDPSRWNLEELLVAALSSCHKLSYLHLCAVSGVIVVEYVDHADGFMEESEDGSGHFLKVILRPEVKLAPGSDVSRARELHHAAHSKCFIANSVNFPVENEPQIVVQRDTTT
jgi:organic hydroperoxide reductase OsmC/OhrA